MAGFGDDRVDYCRNLSQDPREVLARLRAAVHEERGEDNP